MEENALPERLKTLRAMEKVSKSVLSELCGLPSEEVEEWQNLGQR